jgi:hypothetical protein
MVGAAQLQAQEEVLGREESKTKDYKREKNKKASQSRSQNKCLVQSRW